MKRFWWQLVLALGVVGLVLGGLLAVGAWTRDWLTSQPRSQVAWAEVDCPSPPGQTREQFLNEVQFLASMPDQLPRLDEHLALQLREAFGQHPWVEAVRGVEIRPASVHVDLAFRTPVLAVVAGGLARAVDGHGILLPTSADCSALPQLTVEAKSVSPSGSVWENDAVLLAAQTVAFLHPHQDQFRLTGAEVQDGEVRLTGAGGVRVIWGHAPTREPETEARAAAKLKRLLAFVREHGDLAGGARREHDVRPRDKAVHRTIP